MSSLGKILYTEDEIAKRIKEMSSIILEAYPPDEDLVILAILKGSVFFLTDFTRALKRPVLIDFLSIGVKRVITYIKDLSIPIKGKHVLLLEDVIGTGLTLGTILQHIESFSPKSLKVLTLLDNPKKRLLNVTVHYSLFTMPDTFVVGYGLDYQEKYRNLPDIYEVNY